MTHLMAYLVLITAGIGACAVAVELVMRSRTGSGRWVWIAALGAAVSATVLAMVVPLPVEGDGGTVGANVGELVALASASSVTGSRESWLRVLALADTTLPVAWMLSTVALLVAIAFGQHRLRRERRRSSAIRLNDHDVLLTENLGPAVAGVRSPVVFVPRWVLALDVASQQLLLAHEMEHLKRRDTSLLFGGAVTAALLPWNPVVWWMIRRLRLAVEQDCDARVLAEHPGVRRYADLLLLAASRHGVTSRLLAAHFGEHTSDLVRRIESMTFKGRVPWRRMAAAGFFAAVLIGVACETPRPEPVAPNLKQPTVMSEDQVYFEYQVEKPVTMDVGSSTPRYPDILKQAGVEGEVLVSFVVDEAGEPDGASFKALRTTHELFATAVRTALPTMRFTPAEVGGKKVKQLVQQPFSFSLPGGVQVEVRRSRNEVRPREVEAVLMPPGAEYIVRRGEGVPSVPPNIIVMDFEGRELGRDLGKGDLLTTIVPQSIHSIEVTKGSNCSPLPCPLITVRLAKGQTLQSFVERKKR